MRLAKHERVLRADELGGRRVWRHQPLGKRTNEWLSCGRTRKDGVSGMHLISD